MNRLLRIEWNKLFYNRGTRIFLILYFIMILAMGLILPNFKQNLNGLQLNFIELGALNFPTIWHNISWLIGLGKFFLGIIVINNITNEYSFGTFKQNSIDGLSRLEFFSSKLIMNLIFVIGSTLLVFGIVMVIGAQFAETFDFMSGIEFLAGYFVELFAFISLVMFLAFLFKKSTFAILSIFILMITELIFVGIESFIGVRYFPTHYDEWTNVTSFLPLRSNANIIDFPSISFQSFFTTGKLFKESHVAWEYFGVNVLYIIAFLGLSYLIIKKRDL